jgi:uncharacterized protein DUF5761
MASSSTCGKVHDPLERPTGPDGCYYSQGSMPTYVDIKEQYLWDGTRFQHEPYGNDVVYPPIYKAFYSDFNIRYLQDTVLANGFNAAPARSELLSFMNDTYTWDMPNGAYNILDPNRDRTDQAYVRYYVNRLNNQVLNRVMRNMSGMRQSRKRYLEDISQFRGPMEINRPINASCKTRGSHLRLDFQLPDVPEDQASVGYNAPYY